jgi:diguanylate cyclase
MQLRNLDWSPRGWPRVFLWTIFGTLGCVIAALYVDSFNFPMLNDEARTRAIFVDILLPTVLAAPLILFFTSKLRELAIAHQQMSVLATTDNLTEALNRGAFTMLVDTYLRDARAQEKSLRGALLVVDVDHFKVINDSYGHPRGDEALKIIVAAMRGVLRGADIMGRLGGEEFGVFLPGASAAQAESVAERIRVSVNVADFRPDGESRPLSVSVGGATFERRVDYVELFKIADRKLYDAKQKGRNRVSVGPINGMAAAA